jgi:outer membrane protein assembly factor BamB
MLITMYRRTRGESLRAVVGMALAALTACGGGGDKSPASPRWTMAFTPGTLEASTYEGESVTVTFRGINSVAASNVKIDVTSSDGVITPNAMSNEQPDQRSFVFTVEVSPDLSPGTYSGQLDLRVCNGADCHDPRWPSWQLPYRFTVHPATNLTPLSHLASVGTWSTYQGNAAHDGRVDAVVDPQAFLRRFIGPVSRFGVVTEGGRVFLVSVDNSSRWRLTALRESDGGEIWHYDVPGRLGSNMSAPAVSDGRVFVTTTDNADNSYAWTFDAATGALVGKAPISSQGQAFFTPTIFGGAAFTVAGAYGGMARFDTSTGAEQWAIGLDQFHWWTPAVDAGGVYAYVGDKLRVHDPQTGALKYSIQDSGAVGGGSDMGSPVLDGKGNVFVVDTAARLVALSLSKRTVLWSEWRGNFRSDVAVVGDALYDVSGSAFEARSATTGTVKWSWEVPEDVEDQLFPDRLRVIAANNLAFISGARRTYAVDLTTHELVWQYPVAGSLAVSANGVLYIAPYGGGRLVAINLH